MYVYDICRNHLYTKLKKSISQTPASMPFDIILLKPVYIPFKMQPAASDYALLSNPYKFFSIRNPLYLLYK